LIMATMVTYGGMFAFVPDEPALSTVTLTVAGLVRT
jgi:hypothetical protein